MLSLCFVELTMGNNFTIDRPLPVCLIIFGCTANDPSIHHFSAPLLLEIRISHRFLLHLIYFIKWTNLDQSLLSGSLIIMARNEIVAHVYILSQLVETIFLPPGDENTQLVWN